MALTAREQRVLEQIAHHEVQDDPLLCRRLTEFSGPSKWAAWPVALLAAVLMLAAFALPIAGASHAAGTSGGRVSIPSSNGK